MTSGGELEPAPHPPATAGENPPATDGGSPPCLPHRWYVTPAGEALVFRKRPPRPWAVAAGLGASTLLWAWAAALLAGDRAPQDRPWTWFMGLVAASATYAVLRPFRFVETWQLSPGRLLIGETRVRSGRWHGHVSQAAALKVAIWEADASQYHRLSAVMPGGRHQTMYDGSCDDGSVQALGSWLAIQADIPFTDDTR